MHTKLDYLDNGEHFTDCGACPHQENAGPHAYCTFYGVPLQWGELPPIRAEECVKEEIEDVLV